MLQNLLNSVLHKLADEAFKKFMQIQEVGEKVARLTRELQMLQTLFMDADRKKIKNEGQKLWVNELINVAYDIEDVIDNSLLLEVNQQRNTGNEWAVERMFKKARKLPALDKLSNQINEILARIDEISNSRKKYGIDNLGEGIGEETMLPLKLHVIPDIDDPNVVGFDLHKESIVKTLLNKNIQRRFVVSITGIGGLGKTTLARKVYNSADIKENFDLRIWVVVSQKFELFHIVRKILGQIRPIDSNEQGKETEYFLIQLHKSLKGKKYLIVLDDVWTNELWYHIEEALVDANNGSRLLITSRNENVAKTANPFLDPYKIPYLSEEQGLQLLLKKAHYNPDLTNNSDDLLVIARKLVEKCCGLPLALVVLGGILSRNHPEHIVWNKILQIMNWSTDGSRCVNILATSYDDLPLALKFCFMYFAAFPEDHEINATELIHMWVAEGFIPQEKNKTLEDTAHRFLNDLAQRNMVEVSERSYDYSIEYCHVHDLLRDLAVEKAREINFLTVCSKADDEQTCREARRVAVHYADCDELMNYANPSLRTLLCFNSEPPNCSRHKLLKVLSDMRKDWHGPQTGPNRIEGLTRLRYLKIRPDGYMNNGACFAKLINNMKFLQTLFLLCIQSNIDLFDFKWDIETLRHVKLPFYSPALGPPPASNLKNLQTVACIRSRDSWETATIPNLPNLRIIAIKITEEFSSRVVAAFFGTLKSLVNLYLNWDNIPVDVFDMRDFPFYQQLTSLKLIGKFYYSREVTIDTAMFPIHLVVLNLYNCRIRQDVMAILEKLYNLQDLYLTYGLDECIEKIRCSASGFPCLQNLFFYSAENLEEWDIEYGAMPMIQFLKIQLCPVLRVPLGLQCLTTLRGLCWNFLGDKSANIKADEIRDLCRHVPHLDIIT